MRDHLDDSEPSYPWFIVGLQCLCSIASVAIWLMGGWQMFLFLSGFAAGAALVMVVITIEGRVA